MTEIEKQSGTKNATILMVFAGVLLIILGYQYSQLPMVISDSFFTIAAALIIITGVITLSTSLVVWFQKPWATKLIVGVGIVVCVCLIIFGFYLLIVLFGPIFWIARTQLIQKSKAIEWHDDQTEN